MFKIARFAAAAAMSAAAAQAAPAAHYAVAGSIAGPDGGWDYASVDPAARTLYIARSENVTAIDLTNNKVRSFGAISRGHAVVPIGRNMLLVTSGRDNMARLIKPADGSQTASLAVGQNPDAAFYDAATRRAYVINARSGTVSVVDPAKAKVDATITLKPALEFGLAAGGTLYVNNEEANEIETIDLATGKAGAAIAMPGCDGPSGLGYDSRTGRLISACANGKAAVVDARQRRLVALLDIGKGPDAVIVDAARRRVFIPCGRDGVLEVIDPDAAGGPRVIEHVRTETGARTGALDPASGTLYLPTARFTPPTAPNTRPAAVPGSFHVLVVARRP